MAVAPMPPEVMLNDQISPDSVLVITDTVGAASVAYCHTVVVLNIDVGTIADGSTLLLKDGSFTDEE